jgi:small subunit ribosomal protein S6
MSLYELVFIAKQEISSVRAKELAKKINDFIKSKGGNVKKEEYWGFKSLAYEINKNKKGHYIYFVLDTLPSTIIELGNQIKLTEDIMRHIFIKIKDKEYEKEATVMMSDDND